MSLRPAPLLCQLWCSAFVGALSVHGRHGGRVRRFQPGRRSTDLPRVDASERKDAHEVQDGDHRPINLNSLRAYLLLPGVKAPEGSVRYAGRPVQEVRGVTKIANSLFQKTALPSEFRHNYLQNFCYVSRTLAFHLPSHVHTYAFSLGFRQVHVQAASTNTWPDSSAETV